MDLVAVLLRAGLPGCDLRAAERGEEATGVMLALIPGPAGAAMRVIWRQHRSFDTLSDVWRAQQDDMHDTLHTVLAA